MKSFDKPTRVWVNCPSKNSVYSKYHGRVGIAVSSINSKGNEVTILYFTEGSLISMMIDTLYLESKNSETNILKYDNFNF